MADVNATADEIAQFNLVTEPRLLADDVTPEAVTRLLSEQGGVMALMSTEGGIFEILAGRYSGSINIDTFLKAHTGDPIIVDRIGRPSLYIPSPRLTMVLTVQPSVVRDLADKPGFRGRGLLARCWFSVPKSMVGYRDTEETLIPSEVTDSWAKLVNSILALPSTPGETRDLTLSSGAKSLLNEYRAVVEEKLRPGAELSDIRDWGSKLPGGVVRLAGILHLGTMAEGFVDSVYIVYSVEELKKWETPISKETMEAAIKLGDYYSVHAQIAFKMMGADERLEDAKYTWAAINKHHVGTVGHRDLWQNTRRRFTQVSDLAVSLSYLEELGYLKRVEPEPSKVGGRPRSPEYKINPLDPPKCTQNTQNPPTQAQRRQVSI